jgi:hypothetical protein
MAMMYGPIIRDTLAAHGIDMGMATIGSSRLRRARQTAALLFPMHDLVTFPHFTEHGAIPENTPAGTRYKFPDWDAFVRHLFRRGDSQYIVVGHGSFLSSQAWVSVTGEKRKSSFANLDGFIIEGAFTADGRLRVSRVTEIPYSGRISADTNADQCDLPTKIAAQTRKMKQHRRKTQRQKQKKRQSGGGLPLAYFQDGAQMRGTYADATGVGLAQPTATMVRAPLTQVGGRRKTKQAGGFSPSIMGSFVANGSQLIPVAAYMGYKMMKKSGRKTRRRL